MAPWSTRRLLLVPLATIAILGGAIAVVAIVRSGSDSPCAKSLDRAVGESLPVVLGAADAPQADLDAIMSLGAELRFVGRLPTDYGIHNIVIAGGRIEVEARNDTEGWVGALDAATGKPVARYADSGSLAAGTGGIALIATSDEPYSDRPGTLHTIDANAAVLNCTALRWNLGDQTWLIGAPLASATGIQFRPYPNFDRPLATDANAVWSIDKGILRRISQAGVVSTTHTLPANTAVFAAPGTLVVVLFVDQPDGSFVPWLAAFDI